MTRYAFAFSRTYLSAIYYFKAQQVYLSILYVQSVRKRKNSNSLGENLEAVDKRREWRRNTPPPTPPPPPPQKKYPFKR